MAETEDTWNLSNMFSHHKNNSVTHLPEVFRLRYSLAEDGCEDSQVALAKSLLKIPAANIEEKAFYSQLAVYWLLKAAKSGNEEAFYVLKDCFRSSVGVNGLNYTEIKKCLQLTEKEKLSRRLALRILRAIMSDSEEEGILESAFKENIDELLTNRKSHAVIRNCDTKVQSEQNKMEDTAKRKTEKIITQEEVVSSIQTCLDGNVPSLSLKLPKFSDYKNRPFMKFILRMWDFTFKTLENCIRYFALFYIPVAIFFTYFFIQIISCAFSELHLSEFLKENLLSYVVMLCFLSMLSFTCFIIVINLGSDDLKKWLHLIHIFEENVKPADIENKYLSKSTYSLIAFHLVSVLYVTLVPLCQNEVLFKDIGLVSFFLMFLMDKNIVNQRYSVNISLLINFLICLSKANIFPVLDYNSNWNISFAISNNIVLCLNFMSMIALPFILPFLYLQMALGSERRGWYLVLLPHWMTLVWMNLGFQHAMISNWFLLPVLYVTNYINLSFIFPLYLMAHVTFPSMEVILKLLVIFGISMVIVKKINISCETKLWPSALCIAIVLLSNKALSNYSTTPYSVIPWEKYQSHCLPNAWYPSQPVLTQTTCFHLKGKDVSMTGVVTNIHVDQVPNLMQTTLNLLPNTIQSWIVHIFGKCYSSCDEEVSTWEKYQCQTFREFNISQCHIHSLNEYEYQITLELSTRTSPSVILFAKNDCFSLLHNLKEGDLLYAVGTLDSNIGYSTPKFLLRNAQCKNCDPSSKCDTSLTILPSTLDYSLSMQNIMLFIFYPLLQYKM